MMTPEIGSDPMNQPPSAFVRLKLTESEAAILGRLREWQIARKKIATGDLHRLNFEARLRTAVARLLAHAAGQEEPWSQRRLAKECGLSWSGWVRCRTGCVRARRWLPKLEAAVARLNAA